MTIVILYVILAISTLALLCVGIAMYLRVRRLAKASESQFRRALDEAPVQHVPETDERVTVTESKQTEVVQ